MTIDAAGARDAPTRGCGDLTAEGYEKDGTRRIGQIGEAVFAD
jgi:hypothetical protein